jgi:ParB/RepB/Spo0J family partition protein
MHTDASNATLREVPVELIDRNPDNPRLFFRPQELETLQNSIADLGIQVPINVFRRQGRFILIDGERRWKCAVKLNLKTIPALVQDEPTRLTNVLLMFNIHALREQWDLLTIAVKLPEVLTLLEVELGHRPTEAEIVRKTGLNRSMIRRCKLLIELPTMYRELLLDELKKPRSQQKLTEDFFIEMEKALRTVERTMPKAIPDKNAARDVLIAKYRNEVIKDLLDLRYLPKIAKAEQVNFDTKAAAASLKRVFSMNAYSLEQAFEETVAAAYTEKDLYSRITQVITRLDDIEANELEQNVLTALKELRSRISQILREI